MLWTKQFYYYDVDRWLAERGADPFKPTRDAAPRNEHWHHMHNADIISMPDKWEYPWYAAWDLAFHVARADAGRPGLRQAAARPDAARALPAPERADPRLRVELRRRQPAGARLGHASSPTGSSKAQRGEGDVDWLERVVPQAAAQLHLVGQPQGPLRQATSSKAGSSGSTTSACSTAARRCRPAGTSSRPTAPPGWRCSARTCSRSPPSWRCERPAYADMAVKFVEHFLWIASAMMHAGERRRDVGRGGRVLLRRAAAARRPGRSG